MNPVPLSFYPDNQANGSFAPNAMPQNRPEFPVGGAGLSVPARAGGDMPGMQQEMMQQQPQPQMQMQQPPNMQSNAQDKLPFEQLTGKEPINIDANGMTMSIDDVTQQQQQAQYMRAMQARYQQQQQQQRQQAATAAIEGKMRDVAKEELKQHALGYIAIGVCLVLMLVLLQQKTSVPIDMPGSK